MSLYVCVCTHIHTHIYIYIRSPELWVVVVGRESFEWK